MADELKPVQLDYAPRPEPRSWGQVAAGIIAVPVSILAAMMLVAGAGLLIMAFLERIKPYWGEYMVEGLMCLGCGALAGFGAVALGRAAVHSKPVAPMPTRTAEVSAPADE